MTVTSHTKNNQNAAFAAAANAIPAGDDGAVLNSPPKANHQTVMPGCTKSERGLLTIDGMTSADETNASAAALAITSAGAAMKSHLRVTEPRTTSTTNHNSSDHSAVFVATMRAISADEDGA